MDEVIWYLDLDDLFFLGFFFIFLVFNGNFLWFSLEFEEFKRFVFVECGSSFGMFKLI